MFVRSLTMLILFVSQNALSYSFSGNKQDVELIRSLECRISDPASDRSVIINVKIDIMNNGMKIHYGYRAGEASPEPVFFQDEYTDGELGHRLFSKDELSFGYDGVHEGALVSSDAGNTYIGWARITEDFRVFLNCR